MADRPYETRTVIANVELREDGDGQAPELTGYASTFNEPYQVGFFREQIHPDAFKRTLSGSPDVRLLVDHEGQPLARTKSGTLHLSTDHRGLAVRATLDPSDPDVQRLLPKMRRGDLDQMSFAFRVPADGDVWDYSGDMPSRTIREANLSGGDVSVVTYPANDSTSASVRARDEHEAAFTLAYSMLAEARTGRSFDPTNMQRLHTAMTMLGLELDAASEKPYGDVDYADPGYQEDGKKRYPIDTAAHVRAAWAFINEEDNAAKYTESQVSSIKSRIKAAADKLGVDIDDGSESNSAHLQLVTRFFPEPIEPRVAASVSYNDREQALSDALVAAYASSPADADDDAEALSAVDMWIVDASDTWVVWRQWADSGPGIGLWRINYSMGEDNTVTFAGDPQQVTASTLYTPVGAQQNSGRPLELALRNAEALALRASRA